MSLTLTDDLGAVHEIDAVLFDMDGTIVDSIAATERLWQDWAIEHGVADRLVIAHGQPASATIRAILPDIPEQEHARLVENQRLREVNDTDGVAATAGTEALLSWLDVNGIPWAVVTSADTDLARARLGVSSICPAHLVTIDDVERGKPHPDPFLLGAQRVGVPIGRCLVVEDTQAGIDSGRAAGAVTAGLGSVDADLRIHDMDDLRGRLARHP